MFRARVNCSIQVRLGVFSDLLLHFVNLKLVLVNLLTYTAMSQTYSCQNPHTFFGKNKQAKIVLVLVLVHLECLLCSCKPQH